MLFEYFQLPEAGETFGPYILEEVISGSILGNFYRARHRIRDEAVLLHLIPKALNRADGAFADNYRKIIREQESLTTAGKLPIRETQEVSGHFLVAYEGGAFRSLSAEVANAGQPLALDQVTLYLETLGETLEKAGAINQGHYFLTPDFCFLDEKGGLRVAGIGLFQSIDYGAFESFVSGAVTPFQKGDHPHFSPLETLSPEIREDKRLDPRSDFYGIGISAYFMLTGRKPGRDWQLPSQVRSDAKAGWDQLIRHCLQQRPRDRYPHYRAFLRDLEHIHEPPGKKRKERGPMGRNLRKVPLPGNIQRSYRSRTLNVIRFGFLALVLLVGLAAGAFFLSILTSGPGEDLEAGRIAQVSSVEEANLILRTGGQRLQVEVRGPGSGTFYPAGEPLLLKGREGDYTVRVSAPRFRDTGFSLALSGGETIERTVRLEYAFTPVRLRGIPGTDVYVQTEEGLSLYLGPIGSGGELLLEQRLLEGTYIFTARHPWYRPARTGEAVLGKDPVTIAFEQVARPAEIYIATRPEGADVFIDGERVGKTPLTFEADDDRESFEVILRKAGYRTVKRVVENDGTRADAFGRIVLERETGTVRLQPGERLLDRSGLASLKVSVNGRIVDSGTLPLMELPAGEHRLVLEHPDFLPLEKRFRLADRQALDLTIDPEPRPARILPRYPEERTVRFFLDQDQPIEPDPDGALPVPAGKTVTLRAMIRDYHSVTQSFTPDPNEELVWEVPLKPLPAPTRREPYTIPYFGYQLIWVDSQSFPMSSPMTEFRRLPNEDEPTRVELTYGYWIGAREVDQALYKQVMETNPSHFRGPDLPVESVSRADALRFCQRLTEVEAAAGRLPDGYVYRLPTEAEWALAARADTETPFSFGPTADPSRGNFHGSYQPDRSEGLAADNRYGTLPTGSFPPNPFGLYDVHGNVAEWTLDRYWDRLPGGKATNLHNTDRGRGYTLRGGSWRDSADRVRTAAREGASAGTQRNSIGFRLVLAPLPDRF